MSEVTHMLFVRTFTRHAKNNWTIVAMIAWLIVSFAGSTVRIVYSPPLPGLTAVTREIRVIQFIRRLRHTCFDTYCRRVVSVSTHGKCNVQTYASPRRLGSRRCLWSSVQAVRHERITNSAIRTEVLDNIDVQPVYVEERVEQVGDVQDNDLGAHQLVSAKRKMDATHVDLDPQAVSREIRLV